MGTLEKSSPMCFHNHFPIPFILISTLFFYCNIGDIIAETNTLTQSDTLNFTTRLVSNQKNFTLGFTKPYSTYDNNNTYLAIWNSYDESIVWIANRDTPITNDSSPTLFIDNIIGKLVINQTHGDPIELCPAQQSTTTNTINNLKAVLLDDGNLVLTQLSNNSSPESEGEILWQSFDCPTDTLLAGMKLGINHRTGRNWTLTSWLATNDPSSGAYTLEWDPHGLELVVKRRGVRFWTSGMLQNGSGGGTFKNVRRRIIGDFFGLMVNKSRNEEVLSYSLKEDPVDHGSVTWRIDYMGVIYFGVNGYSLENICYGDGQSYTVEIGGCAERIQQPECRSDKNTRFELLSGYFLNKSDNFTVPHFRYKEKIGPADCRIKCWNDCDCQAYLKSDKVGCSVIIGHDKWFQPDPSGSAPQNYVIQWSSPSSQLPPNVVAERNIKEWIAISVSMLLIPCIVITIIIIYYWRWESRKVKKEKHLLQMMTATDTTHYANELEHDNDHFVQNLKIFSFEYIVEVTNNFSVQNKLGQGGFGPVYKGKLAEGKEIAVKRLSRSSRQGLVEFKNELKLIAKLQHKNLVRLLGCCINNEENMLIYEYMPNKSLDSFLFDASKSGVVNWRMRVMIIEGISHGLLYLHHHSRLKIIHRDLKVSNILLDAEMNPKISDFGMARIFKRDELIANTSRIVGTYGYMSPEYAMDGIFSIKSDIFSFGVIILEILSGRRNNSFCDTNKHINLIGYAWDLWGKGGGLELMDPALRDSCSNEQLFVRLIQIGLLCVEESPIDRPTISEVIYMITNESSILPMVKRPAFTNLESNINASPRRNDFENKSINNLSISTMNGR